MKIRINGYYEFDKIKTNLRNPKKGDTYVLYNGWLDPSPYSASEDYINIVIAKVKKRNLYYYKNLNKYKIPIDELENIIFTGSVGTIEFYNHYEYQKYIEEEKAKQSNI